jgi:hypothetical protein
MERDGVATSGGHHSLDAVLDHTSRELTVCIPARSLLRERSRPNLDGCLARVHARERDINQVALAR